MTTSKIADLGDPTQPALSDVTHTDSEKTLIAALEELKSHRQEYRYEVNSINTAALAKAREDIESGFNTTQEFRPIDIGRASYTGNEPIEEATTEGAKEGGGYPAYLERGYIYDGSKWAMKKYLPEEVQRGGGGLTPKTDQETPANTGNSHTPIVQSSACFPGYQLDIDPKLLINQLYTSKAALGITDSRYIVKLIVEKS